MPRGTEDPLHIAIIGPIATADICHLLEGKTSNLPVGYSGAPLLITLIAELLRRGHRVTAVTLSGGMPLDWRKPVRARGNNLEMVYVPMRRRAWQPNGWKLGRIVDLYAFERRGLQYAIEQAAPDVVHAHWSYEFAWAAQRAGLPALITCHDSPFLVARMFSQTRPTRSLYRWLRAGMAWHVLRHASHVTAVSPYMQVQAQPLCKCPVSVVPNPLPLSLFDHPVDPSRQPDPHLPVLAIVANGWGKLKNPEPALEAYARLRMRKPGARLKLYGADFGPGERAEQWARQNGIAEGMEFIGHVPYGQLLAGLAAADVLVHSSLEESFGMSVAEAMALGVPVIGGAHSGAVPWVVGEGGILTDVTSATAIEQAMLELLDNPERYRVAASVARARTCDHFTAARVADAYETIYRRLAGVTARKDPSSTEARVAVLMACHNRRESTLACLRALRVTEMGAQQRCDVYLLDDGSKDGTAEAVAIEFPHVRLQRGDGSLFWNGSMHRVFEAALGRGYDFYLFLNDDTLLYADALKRLLTCHERITSESGYSGIVVGSTRDATSGVLTYGGEIRKRWWKPVTFDIVHPRDYPVECDTMNGNVVLIPDIVARKVGNLEPSFSHAMGDTDYGLRAKSAGYSNWVMPGFAGTCSQNSIKGSFLDGRIPLRERLKKMTQPKGLPPKSWLVLCRRHAGPLWIVFWTWPYFRVVFSGFFGYGGARSDGSDRHK